MNRKKFITTWIAAALLASCSADWEPDTQPCELLPIRLTANAGGMPALPEGTAAPGHTRAASTDGLQNTEFAEGEDVAVYIVDCDNAVGTYTATPYRYRAAAAVAGHNALTYYSDATTPSMLYFPADASSNVDVYAFYPYSRFASVADRATSNLDVTVNADQSTADGYRASDVMMATPVTDHSRFPKTDNAVNLTFRHLMARLVVRLKQGTHAGTSSAISASSLAGSKLTIGSVATEATLNMTDGTVTTGSDATTVTVADADLAFYYDNADAAISATEYAIVLPAQALSSANVVTITTAAGETISGTLPAITLTAGISTVLTLTVSDSGIEATRAKYSATSGQTWEKIPEGALSGQFSVSGSKMVYFSKGNLQYVGTWQFATNQWDYFGNSQSDDHRDLFGWGTGNNPNEISTDNSIYSSYHEWGANAITNGGNTTNKWRTLTRNEWQYLLFSRTTTTNLATSNARFAKANVNSKNGLIIFPNHYIHPSDVTVPSNINDDSSGYGTNYNTTNWAKMEAAGAAFIPNAGYRDGSTFNFSAYIGYYWSSTQGSTNKSANILYISASRLITNVGADRCSGRPVRLVQNVQ